MNENSHSHGCVQQIDDPDDIRLSPYRSIREKDLVGRQQRFIAEGKVVLNVLFSSSARFETESLLVLENRLAGLSEQLGQLPPDVPVYSVPQTVMDMVAGFHVHRGILAVGRRKTQPSLDTMLAALPAKSLVVVLCGISNHDNVGSIFRNAAAFEADCVLMDETCCDPLYRKAIRVSVGSVLSVPFSRGFAAQVMLERLAAARGAKRISVDASDSAQGFFAARGYTAQQRNSVSIGDEWLANTTMTKTLADPASDPSRLSS